MAVPQTNPRTIQAPPDLPPLPGVPDVLVNYLRNFALWCRHGFADKISGTVAQPGIMLLASDAPPGAPKVFMLQVKSDGSVITTPMPLGTGAP